MSEREYTCPDCQGYATGQHDNDPACGSCMGSGVVQFDEVGFRAELTGDAEREVR